VLADGVGVLNAADPRIADMAELCDGAVLLYAPDTGTGLPTALTEHQAAGGRVAWLRAGQVMLAHGASALPPLDLAGILRRKGHDAEPALTEALLAAIAAAWAFGISPELIAAGIETFELHPAA